MTNGPENQQQPAMSAVGYNPPTYAEANAYVFDGSNSGPSSYPVDKKEQPKPQQTPSAEPYVGTSSVPATRAGAVTVYHYVHPVTQHRIDSLLPPDHPEMQCLQFGHVPHTRFGLAGILATIFWFPLGAACLLIDKKTVCSRCKKTINDTP
ncbi:SubName: Full=Uncharacterized protein {ECO:0000313/EMBL:CCA78035.1} [Serendipita indica DSM 11827]|uniref:Brain protein I3 n=1 Tax=Serendipita indica (strain DSM 11827) TaxID=1109443 RepID=G4U376_SERID|nr:SubName: Full=Uncharacterized protein {ECO:0000313/EMBL:CCA78035.1} [Serendipita indica DSM 11827]CCA78035.1 hypothetical protein PIIN_06887 [Serendipita indica DSM 11827]